MNPQTPSHETVTALTDTTTDGLPEAVPAEEPAGRITLSGRGGATARLRALAGLALGTGLVAILNDIDTSVSAPILPL
ncbi:hypothetical protein [Streptomyces lancefieldiae]|uniref:Uncharacterized protein n=1 Tax=Streptomyces lancefieldiae TaxID=3075520 RepID=A0ABU3AYH0_9ACTN|nr:hypothetical protein [Streptomyces sp. DSM 40712]MDT0615231.1 hypothetical protein [Streptomyces sp. DSM 40712]